nr:hypothetical protein [Alphaproteobacteria bacterium]
MYKNLARILAICIPLTVMWNCNCDSTNEDQFVTDEETENYPFKKSQSQLSNDDVVGIRIKDYFFTSDEDLKEKHVLNNEILREYDIRGIVGQTLFEEDA